MMDYMRGLQQVFSGAPECSELQEEIDRLHLELIRQLDKTGCRKLLRLLDAMYELQDEISLTNFIAGFRLAAGIAAELCAEKPYSFDQSEEEKGKKTCEF